MRRRARRRGREAGYAVIAAMVCAAGAALTAAQLTAASRGAAVTASAEAARAKLTADAEAGFALAMSALEDTDPNGRWTLGGDAHTLDFDDAVLTIRVEDERGKIPLDTVGPTEAEAMFRLAGADPDQAKGLAQALLFQRDPSLRALGADDDAAAARQARGGAAAGEAPPASGAAATSTVSRAPGLGAVRDLLLLPGMTPEIYDRLAPAVTVSVRDASFEPRTAPPLALAVMTHQPAGSVATIERAREAAGQRTALDTDAPLTLAGRPLTIRVQVQDARGDRYERASVVELTRAPQRPYVVRLISADGA